MDVREIEEGNTLLVSLESFFEVFVFFQPSSIIQNNLRGSNSQLQYFVVHGLGGLEGANRLLNIYNRELMSSNKNS